MQIKNWQNNIVHPLDLLISAPNETRNRAVDRACRDYENKFAKAEVEAKKHAKVKEFMENNISMPTTVAK